MAERLIKIFDILLYFIMLNSINYDTGNYFIITIVPHVLIEYYHRYLHPTGSAFN